MTYDKFSYQESNRLSDWSIRRMTAEERTSTAREQVERILRYGSLGYDESAALGWLVRYMGVLESELEDCRGKDQEG